MSNQDLWDRSFKTDPAHVKAITGKDYSGNSPKPYYIVERLTNEFGPCGIGWGYKIDSERFERFSDSDVLHIAMVTLWYKLGDQRGEVTQMGQTKATYVTASGKFKLDEDAPKKSVTDALVKCASYLGFAGDIFSGRWDDSKYVAGLKREFSAVPPLPEGITTGSGPKQAYEALTPDWKSYVDELATYCDNLMEQSGAPAVQEHLDSQELESNVHAALWNRIHPDTRKAVDKITKGKVTE